MKHLPLALVAALILMSWPAAARGTQEDSFQEARGKGNFTQSIDLTSMTPGQYNLLVRTTDAAGNVSFAGPFNFYYDPSSDNPLMSVANPAPGIRIGGSFNAVGVASAPKGVALVEVQVDDGPWAAAQGKAFWSFPFQAAGLDDGVHRLSVRGTDVNGVMGPPVTVAFHLDQKLPVFTLTSLKSGDRVQGTVALEGRLTDGNGISELQWSTDGRRTFTALGLSGDSQATVRNFAVKLDTRRFGDGPVVLWFAGKDAQGSEVRQAILLNVDNTAPHVTVLAPAAGTGLHGRVRFVIQAEKALGLRSLTARVGPKGDPVPLQVIPGNPFHVVDLELPNAGSGVVAVVFEAVDTAGKSGQTTYLAQLNGDADLPQIHRADDWSVAPVRAPLRLAGTFAATDGPAAIAWSLNGSPETLQPVGAAFDFPLPGPASGPNKLVLVPVDAAGRRGKVLSQTFTAILGPPVVHWEALVTDAEVPLVPGLAVRPDRPARIRGTIESPNPLKSLVWSLGGGKETPVAPTVSGPKTTFVLTLPDDPPFGTVPVQVRATDVFGQETTLSTYLEVTNLARAQGPDGMVFADPRLGGAVVVITPETPLTGSFAGGKIKSADLLTAKGTVAVSVLQAVHDGQRVTIRALKDGLFEGVRLKVVSDRGRAYETELGTLIGDTAVPSVRLASPVSGTWAGQNLKLEGQVTDNNGIARLEWSSDGKAWQGLDPPSGTGGAFTRQLELPGNDGLVNLLLRATDGAGRTGTVLAVVRRDTQAPEVELFLPPVDPAHPGTVYAVGRIRDEGALQKGTVTLGRTTAALDLGRPFVLALDGTDAPVSFRVTDWAGNTAEPTFRPGAVQNPAPEGSKPEIQILFPRADVKGLNGLVPVVGRISGFSRQPRLTVRTEAGVDQEIPLTSAGWFSLETDLSSPKGRSLVLTAVGDSKESASLAVSLPSDPAAGLPSARFPVPSERPVLTGNVTASGWIGDSRGVVSWISQLDGGERKTTVPDPSAAPVGTFLVDLGVPAPGTHKLTVIPVNGQGKEGPPAVTEFVSTVPSGPVEFFGLDVGSSLVVTKESRLKGRIASLNTWKRTEVRFADLLSSEGWEGPFQPLTVTKASDGSWAFDTVFPSNLPFSRIGVVVRGEDSLGQKVEGRTVFHKVWPKDPALVRDDEGIVFSDGRLDQTGRFSSVPGEPLVGGFRGRPVKTVVLEPLVPALEVRADGSRLTVEAREEGLHGPFRVVLTTIDGDVFRSAALTYLNDREGPELVWESPSDGGWLRDAVQVSGAVSDPSGVAALEVSVNGGQTWSPVGVKTGRFDVKVPVPGPDGLVRIVLRATDRGGRVTQESRALLKDGSAPTWTLVAPPADRRVNGLTTLAGTASDLNPITAVEISDDGKTFRPADGTGTFAFDLDFASYAKLPEQFWIRTTDSSGNQAVTALKVPLDQEADKPVVQIQTPAEGEVIRADFVLGGITFDDDGIGSLAWRLDGGPWQKLDQLENFQVPVALGSLADNEHVIEVQAEDIYGTRGNIYRQVFRVSLMAPQAVLRSPTLDTTVSGVVSLVGASFDRNGVSEVQMSLDNGLSWYRAGLHPKETFLAGPDGAEFSDFFPSQRTEWEWRFDSRTLKDGTYLVMAKTLDGYGTPGLLTTLVNIDNQAPSVTLTEPLDGTPVLDSVRLEGRSHDNIQLVSLKAELRPLEGGPKGPAAQNAVLATDLPVTPTFGQGWSLGSLADGWYNLRLEARDAAGNTSYVARNIRVEGSSADKVEILYPQDGETLGGSFLVEGRVTSRVAVSKALIDWDGGTPVVVAVEDSGFFSLLLDASHLTSGDHQIRVSVPQTASSVLMSEPRMVHFDSQGPWIRVTSHKSGAFVSQRPFVSGFAGWSPDPLPADATEDQKKAAKVLEERHRIVAVEGSLDNGKTFTAAQGTEAWKFRLETLALADGPQPLVFRVRFQDGTTALQRLLVTIAQTAPSVEVLTNLENGRFNGTLEVSGFTEGTGEIRAVEVAVRQGDKAGYEVPQFIQGMYVDSHFFGATLWEAGAGLTFFQDAVKLQAQVGQTPELMASGETNRFWGTVAGVKLVANVAQLPGSFFLGPDWAWLSSSFGVGANFAQFSMKEAFLDFSSPNAVMLGGIVFQWETSKLSFKDQVFLRSVSWYNEATVWFISSDVQAGSVWTYSTGLRVGLF